MHLVPPQHKYSYAIVDGHLEKVGNYNVEPPGLFRGRGKHPKTGKLKARVMPSDIALNCAESVCVPRCNVPGYAWQTVQHDPSVREGHGFVARGGKKGGWVVGGTVRSEGGRGRPKLHFFCHWCMNDDESAQKFFLYLLMCFVIPLRVIVLVYE